MRGFVHKIDEFPLKGIISPDIWVITCFNEKAQTGTNDDNDDDNNDDNVDDDVDDDDNDEEVRNRGELMTQHCSRQSSLASADYQEPRNRPPPSLAHSSVLNVITIVMTVMTMTGGSEM